MSVQTVQSDANTHKEFSSIRRLFKTVLKSIDTAGSWRRAVGREMSVEMSTKALASCL